MAKIAPVPAKPCYGQDFSTLPRWRFQRTLPLLALTRHTMPLQSAKTTEPPQTCGVPVTASLVRLNQIRCMWPTFLLLIAVVRLARWLPSI